MLSGKVFPGTSWTVRWPITAAVVSVVVPAALACAGDSAPSEVAQTPCGYRELSPISGDYVPGEVIVGFEDGTSLEEARAFLEGYGVAFQVSAYWEEGHRSMVACVEEGREEEWIERLEAGEMVKYAEVNQIGWIQP
jgi:hypothetical protein